MKTSMKQIIAILTRIAVIAVAFYPVAAQEEEYEEQEVGGKMTAVFINEHSHDGLELYWVDPDKEEDDPGRFRFEAIIEARGGAHHSETYVGHEFYYEVDGEPNYVEVDHPNANDEQVIVLAGSEGIRVRCDITVNSDSDATSFDIIVQPSWAPRGASRFLELVRMGYYNEVVFNRVVPQFLIQFGIAKDYELRTEVSDIAIWDDYDEGIEFEPGFISYAGSGPDSRTAEIFIVMPNASTDQLERFGENAWETPFGFVEGDLSVLSKIYSGYGDMPPWGNGPDSQRIYAEDGYTEYLPSNFPELDSIQTCYVVEEVGLDVEEEL